MRLIPMQSLNYEFNEDGTTAEVQVSYNSFKEGERINTTVKLNPDNVNIDLERASKLQIDNNARARVRDLIMAEVPEDEEEPNENEEEAPAENDEEQSE